MTDSAKSAPLETGDGLAWGTAYPAPGNPGKTRLSATGPYGDLVTVDGDDEEQARTVLREYFGTALKPVPEATPDAPPAVEPGPVPDPIPPVQ